MKIKSLIYSLLAIISLTLMHGCTDEVYIDEGIEESAEGYETIISLNISLPEMSKASRGEMPDGADTEINSLWVGIFSAASGECTYAKMHTEKPTGNHGNFIQLNNIETLSGPSYIVAVANPGNNYGIYNNSQVRQELSYILPESAQEAVKNDFTWDKYCGIAINQLSPSDIKEPIGNLVMSGVYKSDTSDPSASDWEGLNYETVNIPVATNGNVTLPGAIHLRRLISQVKFNIKAADTDGKMDGAGRIRVVSVTPVSYRVYNVPYISWLHERKSPADDANAGDNMKVSGFNYDRVDLPYKANYRTSALYSGSQFIIPNTDGSYNFDFWMLENKRRAVTSSGFNTGKGTDYNTREKEIKADDGSDEGTVDNKGIYTALCGDSGNETMNNCATFVELRCTVVYTDPGLDDLNGSQPDEPTIYYRKADAVYTIHLGGIGNDWNDFTHRRNHKYTYNVTVVDVETIKVEAEAEEIEDEEKPGTEGVVSDVTNPAFDLDAHYGVFNISLSNAERTLSSQENNGNTAMPFRMEVYYNDERIIIDQRNIKDFDKKDNSNRSEKLWQWVEFRPTINSQTLAEYQPYGSPDKKTFRVNELSDVENYPGTNGSKDKNETDQQWYTVFVNEYVYETSDDESKNNWVNYVNQSPRSCWIQITGATSKDKESLYLKSKYMITQKSIQTFYDIPEGMEENADVNGIGLEHENETFGFNLRWYDVNYSNMSANNGRRNQLLYTPPESSYWNNYVDQTKLQVITNVNHDSFQYDLLTPGLLREGEDVPYYVPSVKTLPTGQNYDGDNTNWWTPLDSKHNINSTYYLRIMDACMNRNRDNNGNGIIDRDEIRWYLPAASEIVDMVIGRNSLETPVMDYARNENLKTPQNPGTSKPHHANTRFHFATSNKRVLWAEEGVTVNDEKDGMSDNWNLSPWQVRCVRALGTHLSEYQDEEDMTPAFTVDNKEAPTKIYPTYYDSKNMRSPSLIPLQPHQETSTLNRLCDNGFEFKTKLIGDAIQYYTNDNDLKSNHDKKLNDANTKCQNEYGTEWRLPNMKEAALIKLALTAAGYYGNESRNNYDIGSYITCTYREYGIDTETRTDKTGYYTCVLYDNNDIVNGHDIGRVQCNTVDNQYYKIRCVRDLK